ncbi:tRNA (N6-isopentenyl adenosine(37)-C2)-methylthiotransferase MiaB [Sporanaerobacter acetigenes]|uniref:tRNA-2-methylthio-N(6)-dimethylallyladenosine synthase n=1 Tax=Sporanaerobacter acetigenes DSM 13106 TaxID=1123281 RepID=A0A1M5XLJ7_9FIRM|nr:tRNA (N6-isopentenyl adenosine(37)-C2)-methylthiotransferase MiaB [Sporanaerobacter acetigenes]SHI00609.1 tRNA-i(6)A37 thiotransferase enzyme MiaB [Sporanaerobacter acetigenes DSM 13106]
MNSIENKKYMVVTHGCQMNEHDSEKISWILENMGYILCDNKEECDLIIYNTCLVRENAEVKVYGQLGELKGLKRKKPDLIIGICGCMTQREDIRDYISKKFKHVDIIFGPNNIHKLPQLIDAHLNTNETIVDVVEDSREIVEDINFNRKYNYKSFVNIMYGCNNFCTYCIVPYTRGRETSREPKNIISEIEKLAEEGYKEVTLLGQNVNSYGKTLEKSFSFAELLREINKIDGIERIRFMTSHPKDLSDELIYTMRDCEKVCEHLHLPVQSGSNSILESMNRKYTREKYLQIVNKVKQEIPNIAITTDIIVGFPGETEEDFEKTLDLVKEVEYDSAFTFLYSIREGTIAAKMENQIPDDIKHERFQKLLDTLYPIFYGNNLKYKDKIVEVLVEEISKTDDKILTGRTRTNKLVHFEGDSDLIGNFVNVRITEPKTFTLEGHII